MTHQNQDAFERNLIWHFPNFWGPLRRPESVQGPGMGPSSTIIQNDWKLIYYYSDQRFELFNLRDDLGETNNLADQSPEKVRMLAQELSDYLQEVHAPMLRDKESGTLVPFPIDLLP